MKKNSMRVRVRTAPSPTGIPHIGNTWAALINFVFVRKNKGQFILRLEDTDRERLVPESAEKIYETLRWLGLNYDEGPDIDGKYGPYLQSERLDIYKKYVDELLEKSLAYKEGGAIRFKTKKDGITSWYDLVGGKDITFSNNIQEDFVLIKSDGYPTYNFANVVDDHLMEITHTIRGNEFISSTPKHIMLYQAFNWSPPQFAHLPVLLGADRTKLSKRHGAKSALEFRDEGYLKEAIINFLGLLGWSHPQGKEIFNLEEMISLFDFKDMNLASPIFDIKKLAWMNGEYIRKAKSEELKTKIWEFLGKEYPQDLIEKTIPLVQERIKKLSDYMELAGFFFEEPKLEKKYFSGVAKDHLEVALGVVEGSDWEEDGLQQAFFEVIEDNKFNTGGFFMTLRLAITGSRVTPPIVESIVILERKKTVSRLKKAIKKLT